ncbi:hypothetical protein SAMN04489841_4619 [Natrinema salaciae]|uniref:Uncharacterized protein n=1 Tax=Natrinema salaciae TaxID=1186196 RepID=A0A1H9S7R1_9EURY|nr:hypothetical protein SAMN04489841_4619 [Natrinema salaciae]
MSNWVLDPDTVSGTALIVACVLSGYHDGAQSSDGTRAGAVTAAIGGVPILLWQSGTTALEWWNHPILVDLVGDSWLMAASSVAAAGCTVVIGVVVFLIVGQLRGFIGGWLHDRLD